MNARLNYLASQTASKAAKQFMAVGRSLKNSELPAITQELVALRVSQINGCAICVDMHTKEAVEAGETSVRLNLVAVWRDATVFTDAERAALELAEEGTRVADAAGGVSDEVWAAVAKHYDDEQLTSMVILISFMNSVNRLNIITQQPCAGDYKPGMFG